MAWAVAVSYGLAPGFGALIGFDFHEVALAVPLLALSMAAMVRGDHRSAVLWALPLVLVKEDLGLTVAALGLVVLLRGSRRWGAFAMAFGAVAFVVLAVWLPHLEASGFAESYAPSSVGEAWQTLGEGARNKVRTVLFLLLPDRVSRPALADAAHRGAADLRLAVPLRPLHLLGPLVPVRRGARPDRGRRDDRGSPAAAPTRPPGRAGPGRRRDRSLLLPQQALKQVWDPDFWRTPARTAAVDRVLAEIPDDTRVAASDTLGGRIALRTDLYLIGDTIGPDGPPLPPSDFDEIEWIALDTRIAPAPVPGVAWLRAAGRERRVRDRRGGRRSRRGPDRRWLTRSRE